MIKNWNDFNLNEGLFDFFKGRKEDKDFQRRIKEVKKSFKELGINPKFESSRDTANWTWSDSVYGTRLNLQIELRSNRGKFICDVPNYPDLSFKNDFGKNFVVESLFKINYPYNLYYVYHVVESLFNINYPYSEVEEVFKELGDSLDDISKPNFDFVFVSYGSDFIPSGTRCAWEIDFSMPESLYESEEYRKVFSDIESRLNNMGWSLYLDGQDFEKGEYGEGEEWFQQDDDYYGDYDEYEEEEEEEEVNESMNIIIFLSYHCYPTDFPAH